MRALAAELAPPAPAVSEVEYSFEGVRIHGVLLAESHSGLVVMETPPGARTTLMPGDRVVGCYGQAPQPLHVASLAGCRSPEGGYAFLVERGGGQVAAVVLKKGSGPFY
jgi:hypothetical protein